jgi:hypothetical protein
VGAATLAAQPAFTFELLKNGRFDGRPWKSSFWLAQIAGFYGTGDRCQQLDGIALVKIPPSAAKKRLCECSMPGGRSADLTSTTTKEIPKIDSLFLRKYHHQSLMRKSPELFGLHRCPPLQTPMRAIAPYYLDE